METLSITLLMPLCYCIKCNTQTEEMTQKTLVAYIRLQYFTYNSNRVKARTIRVHVVTEKNGKKNMFSELKHRFCCVLIDEV